MKDKPVILVVDDQPENIDLLEAYLVPQGYEIVKAVNGEEALRKISDNQIDLILLDVMMPGMDGVEVTRRVRQDNTHRQLPIVLVSVLREAEDRVKGIDAGCDDFISYPVDKTELLARVRSLLKVKAYNDLMSNYQKELESEVIRRTEELKQALENLQQDIAARKRAEASLMESRQIIEGIINAIPVRVFWKDKNLVYLGCNAVFARDAGFADPKDIIGKDDYQMGWRDQAKLYRGDDRQVIESGCSKLLIEEPQTTPEGNTITLLTSKIPLRSSDGEVIGVLGTYMDITDRKRVENALRASEERFKKIFEEAHQVGIVIASPSFVFEKANPAFCHMMGYSEDELRSMTFADITHPDHVQDDMENVKRVGRGEIPFYQTEKQYINKSGKVLWGNLIVSSIGDEQGALEYYLSMVIDITKQKKAVELMLEATDKYQDLAESISDIFFAMDKNLRYTYWNKASEKLTGIPAEEALAKSLMEIFPDNEARKQVKDMYLLTIETKKPQQLTVRYPGDELIVHEISSYPTKEGVSVFIKDITGRKKAERQLQDTLESLRKAFSTIIQVMVSTVEARDPYTAGHQARSADLSRAIATEMGLSQDKIDGLRMAGSVHDIGKLSIPAEILSKPKKLSEIEFSLIKEHSQKGYDILKEVESPWPLAQIVYQHHERMNGSGYPRNLKGDDILLEARILAVADVVEAMASYRPYRPALGLEAALEEIAKNKGTLYDNAVAEVCLRLFQEKGYRLK
jgi:PAS domain S-box-containing protein